jgi:hypothetical protein
MRVYPAYGRTIASHVVRGARPMAIGVLLSARWEYFNHVPKVCIKPDEWKLGRFELGFLHNLHAVVVPGDEAKELQLAELLVEAMRVGPRLLWVFNADGTKLVDGDSAHDVALYARELAAKAGALDKLTPDTIRTAELVMVAAQARAGELWHREYERMAAKRTPEEVSRWMLTEYEIKDRVRELFSSPWPVTSDAAA